MSQDREQGQEHSSTQRAEELLDSAGRTVGVFASLAGLRIARIAAFAREEFEDMWAEAQGIRRGESDGSSAEAPAASAEAVDATDAARNKAEELDVDLRVVEGTGEQGKIVEEDVKRKDREEKDATVGSSRKQQAGKGTQKPGPTQGIRETPDQGIQETPEDSQGTGPSGTSEGKSR